MKIQVFKKHTQRLRYEARFWACRMSAGWFCPRSDFYRLFEASLKLHLYLRASVLANLAARRRPGDADVQSMQCTLAFRSGQLDQAFSLLELRLRDGDYRAVERLLFRTGSRPQDVHDRLLALERLSTLPHLLTSHRCYSLIAQSYLVIKLCDIEKASSLLLSIRPLICQLAADKAVYGCTESNRRNQAKLLISLCTCFYHLAVLADNDSALVWVWSEMMEVASKLCYSQLNSDACLRMSSNLSRCLAIGALIPIAEVPDARERTQRELRMVEKAVRRYCLSQSGNGVSKTQENHLGLMVNLQKALHQLSSLDRVTRDKGIRSTSQLLNHSSFKDLNTLLAKRLQQCLQPMNG